MPMNRRYVRDLPPNLDFDHQSVPVPGTKRPGQTAHYRNGIWGLIDVNTEGVIKAIDTVFLSGLEGGADREFLGARPIISKNPLTYANHYDWLTYGQVDVKRRQLGSALDLLFNDGTLGGGDFRTVGIWSQNRPEWQIVDIATQSYQMVSVSLYDTLGKDAVEYIIGHAHTTVVFSTSDHLPELLKYKPNLPMLKMIVCMDEISPEALGILRKWSEIANVKVMTINEIYELGQANLREPIPAKPDDLSSICYTSGTTGNPKGVMLTHSMLALGVNSSMFGMDIPEEGSMMSYLPLAHIYGRICELGMMMLSSKIGYFTGDPLRLLEDAQILKPAFFPSVPRVLNRIYQSAMAAGNIPGLKGALFKKAVATKLEKLHNTGEVTHMLWDRLVFKKIQAVLGGKIFAVSSGSAPISAEVVDFMKIALSVDVFEGYGLTESVATATKTVTGDRFASGTVGPAQPVNEVKLADVPAMGYTSEDKPYPRGELRLRGANIFKEYYKDPENTKKSFDEEGFFKTGDIAQVDEAGRFKIIDRIKNIMKLAQGEYVALEKIENTYSASPVVAQLYVHGDSLQSYLLAVVIPDPVQLAGIASRVMGEKGKYMPEDLTGLEKACGDQRVNKAIMDILNKEARRGGLKGFETVKRIHLTMNPFSVQDNTLTPTLKIKRKDAYNKFKQELEGMYQLGEPKL